MYIILGGTGHVGSAVASTLLSQHQPVTIVTRDASKAQQWKQNGASVAVTDVHDPRALREVFRQGKRLFLLNPSASPSTDTDAEEKKSVASIVEALKGSGLEKIVAESTYGAQRIERAGDLGILYDLEQALRAQPIPASIIRAAYYMSNWDASLGTAQKDGVLQTMLPPDFKLPMVAPKDLGKAGARLLMEPIEEVGTHYVEGPQRYSPADVAEAFGKALQKRIVPAPVPRAEWKNAFRKLGFSESAVDSYTRMTELTVDEHYDLPASPLRGSISLQDYISNLVQAHQIG